MASFVTPPTCPNFAATFGIIVYIALGQEREQRETVQGKLLGLLEDPSWQARLSSHVFVGTRLWANLAVVGGGLHSWALVAQRCLAACLRSCVCLAHAL